MPRNGTVDFTSKQDSKAKHTFIVMWL